MALPPMQLNHCYTLTNVKYNNEVDFQYICENELLQSETFFPYMT